MNSMSRVTEKRITHSRERDRTLTSHQHFVQSSFLTAKISHCAIILTSFRREFSGAGESCPRPKRCERLRFVVDDTPSHARTKHVSECVFVERTNIIQEKFAVPVPPHPNFSRRFLDKRPYLAIYEFEIWTLVNEFNRSPCVQQLQNSFAFHDILRIRHRKSLLREISPIAARFEKNSHRAAIIPQWCDCCEIRYFASVANVGEL
jgi:hypothetical protein